MDFTEFEAMYGSGVRYAEVDADGLRALTPALPSSWVQFVERAGLCSYEDGLLWTVDPASFHQVLSEWGELVAGALVIARSSFGLLWVWNGDWFFVLEPHVGEMWPASPDVEPLFGNSFTDARYRKSVLRGTLHKRLIKKLGPLGPTEMFGADPPLVPGDKEDLSRTRKHELSERHRTLAALRPLHLRRI